MKGKKWNVEISIELDGLGSGILTSNFERIEGDIEYNAALDGIESLVLAHACAGVNVNSDKYRTGIETALEAIANNLS